MDWQKSPQNELDAEKSSNAFSPSYPVIEQHSKPARSYRRVFYILLSVICAIISAVLLVLAIILIVTLAKQTRHEGIEYDKLSDQDDPDTTWTSESCGQAYYMSDLKPSNVGRIINGFEAVNNSYPWVVSLRLKIKGRILDHFCAGSIISNDTVITAAHCVDANDVDYRQVVVVTGLHDRVNDLKFKSQVYSVQGVYEDFDSTFIYENDFALLKLDRPIRMGKKVAPICLSKARNNYSEFTGKHLVTVGWGDTTNDFTLELADRLQQSMRRVIDDRYRCSFGGAILWKRYATLCTVSHNMFADQSVCMGDSGMILDLFYL